MILLRKIISRIYGDYLKSIVFYIYLFHYNFFKDNRKYRLNDKGSNKGEQYIISVTTFPVRIDRLWMTIESMLRQAVKPDKIILWLYEGEFNGESSLPKKLLEQKKRGLEIRFCDENIMPHKKYYYTMLEFPDANVITIDDDKIYPKNLLSKLINFSKIHPEVIISTICRKIELDGERLSPYNNWKRKYETIQPSYSYLPIGAGSILYPANSLHSDVLDMTIFNSLSLKADDLWLKIMSLRNNTKTMCIAGAFMFPFVSVIIKNDRELMSSNVKKGHNDLVLNKLIGHYNINVLSFLDK